MITPPVNKVLVRCQSTMNDEIQLGDLKLYLDTSYQPDWHRKIHAEVVALPDRIDRDHYAYQGITRQVEKGDRIYFHYLSLTPHNRIEMNGQDYYLVDYYYIFCRVKNEQLEALNRWVLVEPITEEPEETASGLITNAFSETSTRIGIVRHIGQPKKGEPELGVKAGDKVLFSRDSDFLNTIEGTEYFTMQQEDLLAVVRPS